MTSPYVDGESMNAAKMYARSESRLDSLESLVPASRVAERSTTATIADSTLSPLTSYDLGTKFNQGDISYSVGVFTVARPGLYLWWLNVDWPNTTTTHRRQMLIYVNGAQTANREGANTWSYYGAMASIPISGGGPIVLNAGDTVQAVVYHTAGSSLTVTPRTFTLSKLG